MPPSSCYSLILWLFAFQAAEQQSSEEDVSVVSWSQHSGTTAFDAHCAFTHLRQFVCKYLQLLSKRSWDASLSGLSICYLYHSRQTDAEKMKINQRLEWCNDFFSAFDWKKCFSRLKLYLFFRTLPRIGMASQQWSSPKKNWVCMRALIRSATSSCLFTSMLFQGP